jgi:general secretion pathway protein B
MSFILDALKKSEDERQQVTPAEFAHVPSSPAASRAPGWLWLLGGLLVINAIVLIGFMTRSPAPEPIAASPVPTESAQPDPTREASPEPVATAAAPARTETATASSFANRVAQARSARQPSAGAEAGNAGADTAPAAAAPLEQSPAAEAPPEPAGSLLPSIDELRMQGALSLPDLHVDIHVYSDVPADRFVFINMNKYRESDRLGEGPVIREITRDGVVLEHRGYAFVLPRE